MNPIRPGKKVWLREVKGYAFHLSHFYFSVGNGA